MLSQSYSRMHMFIDSYYDISDSILSAAIDGRNSVDYKCHLNGARNVLASLSVN